MTHDPFAQGSRDPTSGWTTDRTSGAQPPAGVGTHTHPVADIQTLQAQLTALQSAVASNTPVGVINPYYGTSAPTGWLLCDGSTFSAVTYPALNTLLGGTTLPNLKGKALVGIDAAQTEFASLGTTGGAKTVTIASGNLPTHTHGLNNHSHGGTTNSLNLQHFHTVNSHNHGGGTGVHAHTVTGMVQTSTTNHTHDNTLQQFASRPTGSISFATQGPTTDSVGVGNTFETPNTDNQLNPSTSFNITPDATNTTNGGFANTAVDKLPPYTCINWIIKAA